MHSLRLSLLFQRVAVAALLAFHAGSSCASPADWRDQRDGFKTALAVAEHQPPSEAVEAVRPFADHPLAAYLDYTILRRQLDELGATPIKTFIERHRDLPIAARLRTQALYALAKRKDWAGFRTLFVGSGDPALQCADLLSRRDQSTDRPWRDAALSLWRVGHSQPEQCDAVFDLLRARGQLGSEQVRERLSLAAEENQLGLMRYLARSLPSKERKQAIAEIDYLDSPTIAALSHWPVNAHSRQIATLGMAQLARRDPAAAKALLMADQDRLKLNADQRGTVRYQIALWSAASYLPDAAARFAEVPSEAWDARLHEWQVREALARKDDAAALAAIKAMSATQAAELRWRYLEARLRERAGDPAAKTLFGDLAREPSYYGFLAAERSDQAYALCALEPPHDAALGQSIQSMPAMQRALELHAIGREDWARMEWDALKPTLSDAQRLAAVKIADAAGWYDRGPFTLNSGSDLRYYTLRFPLPYRDVIEREAKKYDLDPAWISALIRAESAWLPEARSHANARGLMQLLPSTARIEARNRGLRYPGAPGLLAPEINLQPGIAPLHPMLETHGVQPL
ncbi:MAG: transglycosylase SLT domain-containing protein, partial [Xanthomonadales bacterium]|nr:transglycosylase SLT domain-containing protein [Xanthomonadales bacterium]